MPTTAERLWETARTLPEPLLAEVLDFAEFLRARDAKATGGVESSTSLSDLCGGLEGSSTFAGTPSAIQQQLRDEWR